MDGQGSGMKRLLRFLLGTLLLAVLAGALLFGLGWWYFHPPTGEPVRVVYHERQGQPLTYDLYRPSREKNGAAILFVVSGSWKSGPGKFGSWLAAPFLRRGYTVIAVSHLSQPQALIGEIAEDIQRAVRHIRDHSAEYGIDPGRIGITGGSSGGHLSLMVATQNAGRGDPEGEKESEVQSVAVFFPVTDLLNLGDSTENPGDGGPPISYVEGFGPGASDLEKWKVIGRALSPIYHLDDTLPPVLIIHGDTDTLVPLDQSTRFRDAAAEKGGKVELLVREGKGHGWISMIRDLWLFADWFDTTLGERMTSHR